MLGHLRMLEIVWLLGEQPEGGLTQLLTDGQGASSHLGPLLRNFCLSEKQCFNSERVCVRFSEPLCLSSESEGL